MKNKIKRTLTALCAALMLKHFSVGLIRVLDIVKGFAQRAFNRFNLCNRHISASTPLISSMSSL